MVMDDTSSNAEFIPRSDAQHPARPDEVLLETTPRAIKFSSAFPSLFSQSSLTRSLGRRPRVVTSARKIVGLSYVSSVETHRSKMILPRLVVLVVSIEFSRPVTRSNLSLKASISNRRLDQADSSLRRG